MTQDIADLLWDGRLTSRDVATKLWMDAAPPELWAILSIPQGLTGKTMAQEEPATFTSAKDFAKAAKTKSVPMPKQFTNLKGETYKMSEIGQYVGKHGFIPMADAKAMLDEVAKAVKQKSAAQDTGASKPSQVVDAGGPGIKVGIQASPTGSTGKPMFNPNEPRDWHGKWTKGGGVPRKPPKVEGEGQTNVGVATGGVKPTADDMDKVLMADPQVMKYLEQYLSNDEGKGLLAVENFVMKHGYTQQEADKWAIGKHQAVSSYLQQGSETLKGENVLKQIEAHLADLKKAYSAEGASYADKKEYGLALSDFADMWAQEGNTAEATKYKKMSDLVMKHLGEEPGAKPKVGPADISKLRKQVLDQQIAYNHSSTVDNFKKWQAAWKLYYDGVLQAGAVPDADIMPPGVKAPEAKSFTMLNELDAALHGGGGDASQKAMGSTLMAHSGDQMYGFYKAFTDASSQGNGKEQALAGSNWIKAMMENDVPIAQAKQMINGVWGKYHKIGSKLQPPFDTGEATPAQPATPAPKVQAQDPNTMKAAAAGAIKSWQQGYGLDSAGATTWGLLMMLDGSSVDEATQKLVDSFQLNQGETVTSSEKLQLWDTLNELSKQEGQANEPESLAAEDSNPYGPEVSYAKSTGEPVANTWSGAYPGNIQLENEYLGELKHLANSFYQQATNASSPQLKDKYYAWGDVVTKVYTEAYNKEPVSTNVVTVLTSDAQSYLDEPIPLYSSDQEAWLQKTADEGTAGYSPAVKAGLTGKTQKTKTDAQQQKEFDALLAPVKDAQNSYQHSGSGTMASFAQWWKQWSKYSSTMFDMGNASYVDYGYMPPIIDSGPFKNKSYTSQYLTLQATGDLVVPRMVDSALKLEKLGASVSQDQNDKHQKLVGDWLDAKSPVDKLELSKYGKQLKDKLGTEMYEEAKAKNEKASVVAKALQQKMHDGKATPKEQADYNSALSDMWDFTALQGTDAHPNIQAHVPSLLSDQYWNLKQRLSEAQDTYQSNPTGDTQQGLDAATKQLSEFEAAHVDDTLAGGVNYKSDYDALAEYSENSAALVAADMSPIVLDAPSVDVLAKDEDKSAWYNLQSYVNDMYVARERALIAHSPDPSGDLQRIKAALAELYGKGKTQDAENQAAVLQDIASTYMAVHGLPKGSDWPVDFVSQKPSAVSKPTTETEKLKAAWEAADAKAYSPGATDADHKAAQMALEAYQLALSYKPGDQMPLTSFFDETGNVIDPGRYDPGGITFHKYNDEQPLLQAFEKWSQTVTHDERDTINDYMGSGGYAMNNILREDARKGTGYSAPPGEKPTFDPKIAAQDYEDTHKQSDGDYWSENYADEAYTEYQQAHGYQDALQADEGAQGTPALDAWHKKYDKAMQAYVDLQKQNYLDHEKDMYIYYAKEQFDNEHSDSDYNDSDYRNRQIADLDRVFSRPEAVAPDNMLVWRKGWIDPTVDPDSVDFDDQQFPTHWQKGHVAVEPGYSSCSLHRSVSANFSGNLFAVEVPKGSNAVYLDAVSNGGEDELLLPRNARFAYVGVQEHTSSSGKVTRYPRMRYLGTDYPTSKGWEPPTAGQEQQEPMWLVDLPTEPPPLPPPATLPKKEGEPDNMLPQSNPAYQEWQNQVDAAIQAQQKAGLIPKSYGEPKYVYSENEDGTYTIVNTGPKKGEVYGPGSKHTGAAAPPKTLEEQSAALLGMQLAKAPAAFARIVSRLTGKTQGLDKPRPVPQDRYTFHLRGLRFTGQVLDPRYLDTSYCPPIALRPGNIYDQKQPKPAALARVRAAFAYNPQEKRDWHGRWTSGPQGSNAAGFWEGLDKRMRYVKQYGDPTQAYGEDIANEIYRGLGLNAPHSGVVPDPDGARLFFASDVIDHATQLREHGIDRQTARKILQGYAADVLTVNRDVIGLSFDNILVTPDDEVWRIDNGSAFLHRAQGERKTGSLGNIAEWQSLAPGGRNDNYARIFQAAGYDKPEDIPGWKDQIDRIVAYRDQQGGWDKLVNKVAPDMDQGDAQAIVDILDARTELLQALREGSRALFAAPIPIATASGPGKPHYDPHEIRDWHGRWSKTPGGGPLSSVGSKPTAAGLTGKTAATSPGSGSDLLERVAFSPDAPDLTGIDRAAVPIPMSAHASALMTAARLGWPAKPDGTDGLMPGKPRGARASEASTNAPTQTWQPSFDPKEVLRQTYRKSLDYVDPRVIREVDHKQDLPEYRTGAKEALQKLVDKAKPCIRCYSRTLPMILGDGRIKSQFETGTSQGMLDAGRRAKVEGDYFGYSRKTARWYRPVYGFLTDDPETEPWDSDFLTQYGDATIVLKDGIKDRSTFTVGDSLDSGDEDMHNYRHLAPSPMRSVHTYSYDPALLDPRKLEHIQQAPNFGGQNLGVPVIPYVEAQYHGGVQLSDIDHVVLSEEPSVIARTMLQQAGIKYTVGRKPHQRTPEEVRADMEREAASDEDNSVALFRFAFVEPQEAR